MLRIFSFLPALICLPVLVSCDQASQSTGVRIGEFQKVSDFAFTTQEGAPLGLEDLKGKVWIANFVFTSCNAECLVLSARIAELQRLFAREDDVAFVSFSVDPQTDTPERLETFADRWHADSGKWHFLTGEPDELDHLIRYDFLLPVTRSPQELAKLQTSNLIHSNKFAVVDRNGIVRAYIDGLPESSVHAISQVLVQLLQEPATGASLSQIQPAPSPQRL